MKDVPLTISTDGRVLSDSERRLRERLQVLCRQASGIVDEEFPGHGKPNHYRLFYAAQARAEAWLVSASALAAAMLPDASTPHRVAIQREAGNGASGNFQNQVRAVWHILGNLELDLDNGLFSSVVNQAAALTLDSFLEHSETYLKAGQFDVAGVLAAIAFEDSMRRVRNVRAVGTDDMAIEEIVVTFVRANIFNKNQAARARASAALRTSATHAKWSEFGKDDVDASIRFTRELLDLHLKP